MKRNSLALLILLATTVLSNSPLKAHFPWLVRNPDGKAVYYFSDDISDRTYKLPPSIAAAKLHRITPEGKLESLAASPVDSEGFAGLISDESVPSDGTLVSQVTYGIHRGTRLDYYTVHQSGKLPTSRDASKRTKPDHKLIAEVVDSGSGVDVFVTWQGQAAANIKVTLYCDKGHEEGSATTDAQGKVSFTDKQVEDGLNAIMLGHSLKEPGQLNDASYASASHYLTVTFYDPDSLDVAAAKLAPLPFGITSFGAARVDDAIYVYGGQTGRAHTYSRDSQSNQLLKLDLSKPESQWEKVATGESMQGLGMVAHKNMLILLGGFTAKNAEGEPNDLHSQSSVRAYDLASGQWSDLPDLPEPRSSHDATLIGNTVYVVGGWILSGENETVWHTTAWSMDLDASAPRWAELTKPPFQRRALATVAHQGKLFVIGGMSQADGPTKAVAMYDPQTKMWTELAELIGEKPMAGFGAAGWSIDGQLIVTTYEGSIQKWNTSQQSWSVLGQSSDARFFHRLLPFSNKQLISIGGASMESGKFVTPELISIR